MKGDDDNMAPKVSIITITFNCLDSLKKTYESVISQSYNNIEYVIIDGESEDGTRDFLKDTVGIKWISEKDFGISDAFNKGIKMATGDVLLFLNAGDVFLEDYVVEKAVNEWESNKVDILFYKVHVQNNIYIPSIKYNDDSQKIWDDRQVPHQAAFISKCLFEKIGMYNIFLRIRMDYEFFTRCNRFNCSYRYIPISIVEYEPGGTSMSRKNRYSFYREGISINYLYNYKIKLKEVYELFKSYFISMISNI